MNEVTKTVVDVLSMTKGELVDAMCELEEQLRSECQKHIDDRDALLAEKEELKEEIKRLQDLREKDADKVSYWLSEYRNLYDFVQVGGRISDVGQLEADDKTNRNFIELTVKYETGKKIKPPSRQLGFTKYLEIKNGRKE